MLTVPSSDEFKRLDEKKYAHLAKKTADETNVLEDVSLLDGMTATQFIERHRTLLNTYPLLNTWLDMTFGQLHDGPEAMQCDNMQLQNNFQMEGMGGQTFKMFKMLHPVRQQN